MQINEFSANLFYPQTNMLSSFPQYDVVDYSDDQLSATSDPPFPAPHHVCASGVGGVVREQMFEKPLTPSDVGKLNRLVIPKQHAEKYFPIHGVCSGGDDGGGGGDKGGLLCFEDESGKSWRFRYSYWNSSQSYVLTKGWSRYVKEKKLDAGDVVLFERHPSVTDRFFIGWRRRGTVVPAVESRPVLYNAYRGDTQQGIIGPPSPYQQQPPSLHSHGPKRAPQGNTKRRLRLFGVNLECQLDDDEDDMAEPQTSDGGSSLSSHPGPVAPPPSTAAAYPSFFDYYGSTAAHYPHLGMNFTEDVSQMRNRLG